VYALGTWKWKRERSTLSAERTARGFPRSEERGKYNALEQKKII